MGHTKIEAKLCNDATPWARAQGEGNARRWTVSVHRDLRGAETSVFLRVEVAGSADAFEIDASDDAVVQPRAGTRAADRVIRRWASVREQVGGPLEVEVRDAIAACRRELDLRYPRIVQLEAQHDGYREVAPRSNFETFARKLVAGETNPDVAARAAGGSGRP